MNPEIVKTANRLIQEYTDLRQDQACFDALCQALWKVELAPLYVSGTSWNESGELVSSQDLPEWKKTRTRVQQVTKLLNKIINILEDEAHLNYNKANNKNVAALREVADGHILRILKLADHNDRLPKLVAGLTELRDLTNEVAGINGQAGVPPLPNWMDMAVQSLAHFWRDNGKKPTAYFEEGTYNPKNPFTKFCCEVLTADKKLTQQQCQTILESRLKKLLDKPHY